MDDFIFGTLATEQLKRERVEAIRSGISHNFNRRPLDPAPADPITVHLSLGPSHHSDRAWVYWTVDGSDPVGRDGVTEQGSALPMHLSNTEWDTVLWGYIRHFEAILPGLPAKTLVRYKFGVRTLEQGEVYAEEGKIFAFYVDDDPLPAWTRDAIVYEIFVDRFFPGTGKTWLNPAGPSGFFGGTLRGITEKMDYLADLGVNVLWLTPIFPSPSHHGYDATDLFDIEPRLGSKKDLDDLLRVAHAAGTRVLLDLVPNHVSNQHPIFQSAAQDAKSAYRNWFNFKRWPDEYETFFGVRSLPQINLRNAEARKHVLDAAAYWLDFGVDGYRVDYAIGPAADFWAEFRMVTRAAKPDCWTFGEIVDPPDVQVSFEGQLDGALDFMLLEAIRQSIAFGRWNSARLASFLERHARFFGDGFSLPSFLDNHDMNRFLWAAGNDKRKLMLAALLQFTLAGPPVIYYGTEVGLSQNKDVRQGTRGFPEESRLPMVWGNQQDSDLFRYYQELIELRKGCAVMRRGRLESIRVEDGCLLLTRNYEGEKMTAVVNSGPQPGEVGVPAGMARVFSTPNAEVPSPLPGEGAFTLPSLAGAIFKDP